MPPLFFLAETSAGYALLKSTDKKLLKRTDIGEQTATAQGAAALLKLAKFDKFDSAATALEEIRNITDGKVTPMLSGLLDSIKDEAKASLGVADAKLGQAINKLPQLSIVPVSDASTLDVFRAIRSHLPSLVPGLTDNDVSTMSLGLSHGLSRHKLKFSVEKADVMIMQAIALLDDIDKNLNTNAMRLREWYGWHFPEIAKIINDNVASARLILKVGFRSNCAAADLSDILPEEIEVAVKAAAEISMGSEITPEDLETIKELAEQVIDLTEYRQQLNSYLSARMQAIAPNLTALVGDLVGARLISHAGSLLNLAKSPASTIQILGAEKALFRALKTKHDTPKYGLIYHASLVGQANGKNKGKIARMLAAKAALGLRVDSLADWGVEGEGKTQEPTEEEKVQVGMMHRRKLERSLRNMEGKPLKGAVGIGPGGEQTQPGKWELKEARKYNPAADGLSKDAPAAAAPASAANGVSQRSQLIQEVGTESSANGAKRKRQSEIQPEASTDKPTTINGSFPLDINMDDDSDMDSEDAEKAAKAARKAEKARLKAEKAARRESKDSKKKRKRDAEAADNGAEADQAPDLESDAEVPADPKADGNADRKKKKKKKRHHDD